MTKVKVFQKQVELQGQGHKLKNYGTMWKVLKSLNTADLLNIGGAFWPSTK